MNISMGEGFFLRGQIYFGRAKKKDSHLCNSIFLSSVCYMIMIYKDIFRKIRRMFLFVLKTKCSKRCFSVNIMSRVTFNSLFALEIAYVRSEEDDEFLRGEFPLRFSTRHWRHSFNVARVRFHRSVQALYHT